ncbi:MAG: hypothetical protein N2378_00850 [Chloroflexaceae bacterium]|nr:hypothetical protein [Chloroflexaceae bacterium]
MTFRRALLWLLLIGLFVAGTPAQAQVPPSITLEAQAGYDGAGAYRAFFWFPVAVTVTNDGRDSVGVLAWSVPGDAAGSFEYVLDLPRGARKRVVLPVVHNGLHNRARLTLRIDGERVAQESILLNPIGTERPTLAVISSDATVLNSLQAARFIPDAGTALVRLDPAMLPDDAALLAGLDAIFVHDLATDGLSSAQREALLLWTRLGGQLVIGGGLQAERTLTGLAELSPVDVGALRADAPAEALADVARRPDLAEELPPLTVNEVRLREGARPLDGAGLLTARVEGAGRVIFAAFDLAALRVWSGEAALWERALQIAPRAYIGPSFRWRGDNLLRDALQRGLVWLPSPWAVLALMAAYIVVIGPLNFLLLRRLRRIELAWITTPLIAIVALGLTYGGSLALRGPEARVVQVAIVQGFEGASTGQATAFFGIFSPGRQNYRLDFAPASLVTPSSLGSFEADPLTVRHEATSSSVPELLIDVGSFRTVMVEQTVGDVPQVQSDLRVEGGLLRGQVRLGGAVPLRDAQIVAGAASSAIGDLTPGTAALVELRLNQQNFPFEPLSRDSDLVYRNQVLTSLFGFDRFSLGNPSGQSQQGHPDERGVYLLGWIERPALPINVNNDGVGQLGEALVIIRLNHNGAQP